MTSFTKQAIAIALVSSITMMSGAEEKRNPQQINDLRYGEALFNFYQERYFTSITNLMVAKQRRPITSQDVDPELLLGGLYLYYGLHENASSIFSELIEKNTSIETQDRAWFNIGKMQYKDHFFTKANEALNKVKDTLSPEREAEKQNLLANTYLKQKDFSAAYDAIKNLNAHQDWQVYAKYNMGISLIRSGKNKEGTQLLNQVSSIKTEDEELKALRDKTNVALGYAYIRQKLPKYSIQYLQQVRLKGPLSAKALLGIGWAYQQQNKLEQALVAWMELRDWPVIDTAVQESLLAIPYTLEQMNKNQLAFQHYNYAIDNYKEELISLKSVLSAVKAGELLVALRPAMVTENILDPQYQNPLPESISVPYLQHLVNSLDFQKIHKNYLDLIYLQKNLTQWKNQFPAYYLMLKERNDLYKKQKRSLDQNLRLKVVNSLKRKRDKLANKIQEIEQQQNIYALATDEEADLLKSLNKIKKSLVRLSKNDDFSEETEKFKLFQGLLLWDLSTDYPPRYWKVKNELNQLNKALQLSEQRLSSIRRSSKNAPLSFSGYNKRIKTKEKNLDGLLKKITSIIRYQEKLIETEALASLRKRYHQIQNYHTRASYSLARLYDRMTLPEQVKKINPKSSNVEAGDKK